MLAMDPNEEPIGFRAFSISFKNWSDGVSLIVLALAFLALGLGPKRKLRFHWYIFLKRVCVFLVLVVFNGYRFVTEGIFDAAGPREFMAVTIGFIARWLWMAAEPCRSARCRRWIQTVKAMSKLISVREGESKREGRKEEYEVVVRKAVARVPRLLRTKERMYWRGYEISAERDPPLSRIRNNGNRAQKDPRWLVHIDDETMHLVYLEPLLNNRPWKNARADVTLYGAIYSGIMAAFPKVIDNEKDESWVERFEKQWGLLAPTGLAEDAKATGTSKRAGVARKIAADAVHYALVGGELRAVKQIEVVNAILESWAEKLWKAPSTIPHPKGVRRATEIPPDGNMSASPIV